LVGRRTNQEERFEIWAEGVAWGNSNAVLVLWPKEGKGKKSAQKGTLGGCVDRDHEGAKKVAQGGGVPTSSEKKGKPKGGPLVPGNIFRATPGRDEKKRQRKSFPKRPRTAIRKGG